MNQITPTKLIVMVGHQGSGKSSVAYELSKRLLIPVFSVDPIHSAILTAGIKESFEAGLADYLVAEKLAEENLNNGLSVIIDASNYVKEAHEMWEKLAKKTKSTLKVIECSVDPVIHKERIEQRVRNIPGMSEVTWEEVEKRKKESVAWEVTKLVLNTGDDFQANIEKAIIFIEEQAIA